ncbi:restriction endonuclease subunit S [Vibrio cholerae]
MSDWVRIPLDELVDVIDPHPSHRAPDAVVQGIPFIGIGDIREDGSLIEGKGRIVSEKIFDEHIQRYQISDRTIGFGRVATIGKVISFQNPTTKFVVSPTMAVLEPKPGTNRDFILHALRSEDIQEQIDKLLTGSTRSSLGIELLRKLTILHPATAVAQKISKVLNSVSNQIDATQALIDKYTAIKQGMMADLFSRGIDPETKALRPTFEEAPELYHETPLGMLPKGWDVVELQTVATVERGKFTHRPRDDKRCFGGGYPFIQTGDVAACVGNHLTQYKQTLSDFGRSVSKEFPVGTVAVTIAANIADTAILAMPMCFPDSVVGVVVDERLSSSRFVELCIRMSKPKLDALAPQSAQKNINLEDLRPLKLPFPSRVEQELVCSSYEAINDPINSLINEKKKLIAQKSGLMQDLLTGKVPVPA